MNLKDLSKEQKQYLILGAVVAVAVLGAIVVGVKFSLSSIEVARVELQDLTDKIKRADRSLKNNQRDEAALFKTVSELKVYLEKIPPDQNYYSWATEVIYGNARDARLEVDAINESGMSKQGRSKNGKNTVSVESYSLRIIAHGGYNNIKQFLFGISRKHPLVRITGLEISTGSSPEVHDVQLFIQWPFKLGHITETWKDVPAKRPVVETDAMIPEVSKHEPGKTPTPPAPRVSSESKPVEQPMVKVPEPEKPASSVVQKKSPEPEIANVQPTVAAEPKPSEHPLEKTLNPVKGEVKAEEPVKLEEKKKEPTPPAVEKTPSEPEASTSREMPKETSKSANRLEALLGR